MNTSQRIFALAATAFLLQACDNDDPVAVTPDPVVVPPPAMASFDVTVINLTNAQPLSPAAIVGHQDGYSLFTVGAAASAGLEQIAEGGDNSQLLADAAADANVLVSASGAGPIGPAGSETITVEVLESDVANLRMSIATMLVNTNDAFSAVNGLSVTDLAVGDSMTLVAIAYDAGTEADSEEALHIPGPAGGGEGFNAARDDEGDRVSMHSGVVSGDDGFMSSDLTGQHRFDNPVMRIVVARTQ